MIRTVGHTQDSGSGVLEGKVFISKLVSVDRFSTSSVVVGEVSSLAHKSGDDTVERGSSIAESLFSGAKGTEVLSCLGDNIG